MPVLSTYILKWNTLAFFFFLGGGGGGVLFQNFEAGSIDNLPLLDIHD